MSKLNIVIVGGGTAGWLSALFIRERMPEANITLVESKAIGILGAGEGTTPAFIPMLEDLRIPLSRLVKETSCTIKNGIKFTNWTGDGSYYYHGFIPTDNIGYPAFDSRVYAYDLPVLPLYVLANDRDTKELNHITELSEQNKVPAYVHPEYAGQVIPDPFDKYLFTSNFAVHFDAVALAEFLAKIGTEERNIKLVEGKVIAHDLDQSRNILSVTLDSKEVIKGDFFLDCTGFAKKFIGGTHKAEWISHKEYLTVDSAMPFFLDIDEENMPAYTESIAMDYGWMWKIPLQHRYGCGYVYDSNYLTEEQAREEIVKFLGREPEKWPRDTAIKFDPGYFKTPWVNNCLAIGLAGSFIEPLEATSIWITILTLREAFKNTDFIENPNPQYSDEFNSHAAALNEYVFRFVYAHYMGGRTDTSFWEHYQNKENAPESLSSLLSFWEYRPISYRDLRADIFPAESWYQVLSGLKLINTSWAKNFFEANHAPGDLKGYYEQYLQALSDITDIGMAHHEFLADLKTAPDVRPVS